MQTDVLTSIYLCVLELLNGWGWGGGFMQMSLHLINYEYICVLYKTVNLCVLKLESKYFSL